MFLKFQFQDDWSINVGADLGQNLPSNIDKAHRLVIQQLVAATCSQCSGRIDVTKCG